MKFSEDKPSEISFLFFLILFSCSFRCKKRQRFYVDGSIVFSLAFFFLARGGAGAQQTAFVVGSGADFFQ